MKKTIAPRHLSVEAKQIYRGLVDEYGIDDTAGLRILQASLESFDRATRARKQIDEDGMTVTDKYGQVRPHPLLANERDSRAAFLAGLRCLNLGLESDNGNFRGK